MKYCICYCVDSNCFSNKLLYCSIYSLRKYNTIKVVIMTLISNKYVQFFKNFENVEIMYVDEQYKEKYEKIGSSYYYDNNNLVKFRKDITNMCYFRLEIPLLLKDYEKVLYLDTDTEIKRNIDPLFKLNFDNYEIIGQFNREPHLYECIDVLNRYNINTYDISNHNEENYICSGIMLFDINKINVKDYSYRLKEILDFEYNNFDIHLWKDEFLININFLCKSSKLLDCEDEREYKTIEDLNTNSYIVHYMWKYKPNLIKKYEEVLKALTWEE